MRINLDKKLTHGDGLSDSDVMSLIYSVGIDRGMLSNFPVNLGSIAHRLGARDIKFSNMPVDGAYLPGSDGFTIFINKNQSVQRQRFTCAHEIGHAILNPKSPAKREVHSYARHGKGLEKLCEKIASVLLMPNPGFGNHLKALGNSIETIVKLSKIFLTSIQATAIRFVDVVDEPCTLIVSVPRQTGSERLKILWSHQKDAEAMGGIRYFIPKSKTFDLKSATQAYLSDQISQRFENVNIRGFDSKTYAESKAFGLKDKRFVVTLIYPTRLIA